MKKQNKQKGFTLVELVIVIAVIAILAGVLIPTFSGIVEKAKKSAALQEAKNALTQDLVLAEADYVNIPSTGVVSAKLGEETKYFVKISAYKKGCYSISGDNASLATTEGTEESTSETNYYELVEDQYQGTYDATKKEYKYDNGKYTCIYNANEGGWTTTKNN